MVIEKNQYTIIISIKYTLYTIFFVLEEVMEAMKTNLKHLLNVVIFGLEQLAPGSQVAVGEDAAGLQQPVSVTLQRNTQNKRTINPLVLPRYDLKKTDRLCAPNEA